MQTRKRVFTLFISLVMVLALIAVPPIAGATTTPVGTATDLQNAINSAQPGDVVQLTAPITITSTIVVNSGVDVTLDLNGQAMTVNTNIRGFDINGGSLKFIDSSGGAVFTSTFNNGFINVFSGKLDIQAGTFTYVNPSKPGQMGNVGIRVFGSTDPSATDFSHVTFGGTAKITNLIYGCMVSYQGTNYVAYGVVIDITGGSLNAEDFDTTGTHIYDYDSLYINGMIKAVSPNAPKFNISGGKLGGIYGAGYAYWNITGGDIIGTPDTGSSAVELKAGELNMSGGSLTAWGSAGHVPNGSGTSTMGYGLAVVANPGYTGKVTVNVSGGTITSADEGVAFGIVNDGTVTPASAPAVNISGGTIKGPVVNDPSVGVPYFISGGTFITQSDLSAGNPSGAIDGWIDPNLGLNWVETSPGVYVLGGATLEAKFYDVDGNAMTSTTDPTTYNLGDAYDASALAKPPVSSGYQWVVWPAMSSGLEADTITTDDAGSVVVAYLMVPVVDAPVINDPVEGDTTISGTTLPGTSVAVMIEGAEALDATVDEFGNWSVDVDPLLAGQTVSATATWVSPADAEVIVTSEEASVDVAAIPTTVTVWTSVNGKLSGPLTLPIGSTVADLGTPKVAGYTFKGWALDSVAPAGFTSVSLIPLGTTGVVLASDTELIDGQTYYAVLVEDEDEPVVPPVTPPVVSPKPLTPPLPPMGDNSLLPSLSVLGLLVASTALVALRRRSALLLDRK